MSKKWENFFKNLGEWRGSFTQFSLEGDQLSSTDSIINLESFDNNQAFRFRVRRFGDGDYDTPPTKDYQQEHRTLGRYILVFETGAFSKGTIQLAPFSTFGAEYGLVTSDRRLRLVQLYDEQGEFQGLTLIREFRAGSTAHERPPLTVEQLLGVWEGQAHTEYTDLQKSTQYSTRLEVVRHGENQLLQTLEFEGQSLTSKGRIEGKQICFEDNMTRVVTLLPDGASSNIPLKLDSDQAAFFVEAGWLVSPTERQRLIHHYNDKGSWTSSTHIREHKTSGPSEPADY
ncbi:hypothetical protein C1752_14078 [Acaryochloris thomasi RCC1774]|uniref:Uncharacterized protein n=1 Tax=Acaryochloris thomasi RCC1774 TaxID=1764569 RepID=A0A2W1J702_9CYAN|nr:DUF3598 family protein [Acaryochloris thomasi]PZD70333.1 hypothetical protein C1752_14078 [Acaryochloris thomasi RCC1774]